MESERVDIESDLDRPVREGLPRGYRMRADAHYVEQLTSRSSSAALRSIPVAEIDVADAPESTTLGPLIRSIRRVGIVHPLLVRPTEGRYELVAGRKRLRAAQTIGLATVPCFVHTLDEEEFKAYAEADALQCDAPAGEETRRPSEGLPDALEQVRVEMGLLESAQQLLLAAQGSPAAEAAADVVRMQMARTRWLADAGVWIRTPAQPADRQVPLGAIVADAVTAFEPEARLRRLTVTSRIDNDAYTPTFSKAALSSALTGGLIAAGALVVAGGELVVTAAVGRQGNSVAITIAQHPIAPDPLLDKRFFDPAWAPRPGGSAACLGALAVSRCAERHRGEASYEVDGRDGRLKLTLFQ